MRDAELVNLLSQAEALQQRQMYPQAIALYRQILAVAPAHFPACYGLALCLVRDGHFADAIAQYHAALLLEPDDVQTMSDLGAAYSMWGRDADALPWIERVVQLRPDDPFALLNLGRALRGVGRNDEGRRCNERALALDPDNQMALNNQGNLLLDEGNAAAALEYFNRVLGLDPVFPSAMYNRGIAYAMLNRPEAALNSYDQALALRPDWPDVYQNRCIVLQSLRRYQEALAGYDRLIALQPDRASTYSNRGNMLRDLKRYDDSLADFSRALAIDPQLASALGNRAATLLDLHRYEDAARAYDAVLAVDPDYDYVHGYLAKAKIYCCEWTGLAALCTVIRDRVDAGKPTMHPFPLLPLIDDPALQLRAALFFAADKFPAAPMPIWRGERYGHDKIRLAYLSGDFFNHATAFLMAELFEMHDRERFEVIAFSFAPVGSDEMGRRLRPAFDRFIEVQNRSDREVAEMIRELEIDVLVDLKGYTTDGRLGILGHRPAPVQVSYLGYPGTTGAAYVDYVIADRVIIPDDAHHHYSEHVVTLPDSYQVNDRKRVIDPRTPSRADLGLPEQGFIFCSFNNNYKIMPDTFDVWMRLLAQVDGSVLLLLADNDPAMRNLRREAADRGIDPARLVFAPRMNLPQHLARQRVADLSLDTLPCCAHTTASDALWAGLPIVTQIGQAFAGRVAASLLHAVGLGELVADTAADYEAIALRLACDPTALAELREKLARNLRDAPLFDTARFCRHIEAAYQTMWQRHESGQAPVPFAVPRMADGTD